MAFVQISFLSRMLNMMTGVNVCLPESAPDLSEKPLPGVLYLLHGYSGDHASWVRQSSVERYAMAHNMAVIMPDGGHSFYCNEKYGERYWDYVSQELPLVMQRMFRLSHKVEDTFVAGLSMGAYGAMKLAMNHPERFAAAGSFSGPLDLCALARDPERHHGLSRIFGSVEELEGSNSDLRTLLDKPAAHRPRLYIACGTEDFLYGHHTTMVPLLEKHGWDVTRYDKPGASHTWDFWDEELRKFMDWIQTA